LLGSGTRLQATFTPPVPPEVEGAYTVALTQVGLPKVVLVVPDVEPAPQVTLFPGAVKVALGVHEATGSFTVAETLGSSTRLHTTFVPPVPPELDGTVKVTPEQFSGYWVVTLPDVVPAAHVIWFPGSVSVPLGVHEATGSFTVAETLGSATKLQATAVLAVPPAEVGAAIVGQVPA